MPARSGGLPAVDPALKALTDYGLTGVLVAVIVLLHWHTVKVQVPGLVQAFRDEMTVERKTCREDRAEDRADRQRFEAGLNARLDRIEGKIARETGGTAS
jgi:hypothetical protein